MVAPKKTTKKQQGKPTTVSPSKSSKREQASKTRVKHLKPKGTK